MLNVLNEAEMKTKNKYGKAKKKVCIKSFDAQQQLLLYLLLLQHQLLLLLLLQRP